MGPCYSHYLNWTQVSKSYTKLLSQFDSLSLKLKGLTLFKSFIHYTKNTIYVKFDSSFCQIHLLWIWWSVQCHFRMFKINTRISRQVEFSHKSGLMKDSIYQWYTYPLHKNYVLAMIHVAVVMTIRIEIFQFQIVLLSKIVIFDNIY